MGYPCESYVIKTFGQTWWARLLWKSLHYFFPFLSFFFCYTMWNPCKHRDLLFTDKENSDSAQAALLSFSKSKKGNLFHVLVQSNQNENCILCVISPLCCDWFLLNNENYLCKLTNAFCKWPEKQKYALIVQGEVLCYWSNLTKH